MLTHWNTLMSQDGEKLIEGRWMIATLTSIYDKIAFKHGPPYD